MNRHPHFRYKNNTKYAAKSVPDVILNVFSTAVEYITGTIWTLTVVTPYVSTTNIDGVCSCITATMGLATHNTTPDTTADIGNTSVTVE